MKRPTTICVITGFSDIDSAGNQSMKNNIRYFAEFGYTVHVWSFFSYGFPNLLNPKAMFTGDVHYHRLPRWTRQILGFGKWLKNALSRVKPQDSTGANEALEYYADDNGIGRLFHILFLFLAYLPTEVLRIGLWCLRRPPDIFYGINWQGAVASRVLSIVFRRPLITRFHGTTLRESDVYKWKYRVLLFDEMFALRVTADAVIMTNDGTRGDRILHLLGVNQRRVHFWINGLDMSDLRLPAEFTIEGWKKSIGLTDKKIILMVSRLAAWKRVDRGLYCVSRLVCELGLKDVMLVVVGDGPERATLDALADRLDISKAVRFVGARPHHEVAKYFASADVFLSLYDISNLGNPLLEAIYFGTPIVTLDDGSTDGLLREGLDCLKVKLENIMTELPQTVLNLLEDSQLRARVRIGLRNLRERSLLSWEQRMQFEDKLIRELVYNRTKESGNL